MLHLQNVFITVQIGQDQRGRLKDTDPHMNRSLWPFRATQWNKTDSFIYWGFYILVTTEMNLIRGWKFGKLWKIITICDKLNDAYAKYYSPNEQLAVNEINVPLLSSSI
jgi:hypothetical protein